MPTVVRGHGCKKQSASRAPAEYTGKGGERMIRSGVIDRLPRKQPPGIGSYPVLPPIQKKRNFFC